VRLKLAVVGSRSIQNFRFVGCILDGIVAAMGYSEVTLISGAAAGVDSLAAKWARKRGFEVIEFPADWEAHGRSAGFIRNRDIVESADGVVAIWDGISKGTANSISLAKKRENLIAVINLSDYEGAL
jgi:hypothetical protein